jgi:hypothetical protein
MSPRVVLASLVAVAGAVAFRLSLHADELTIYIPVGAVALGAVAIHFNSLGAQLFGRALFWSNFVLGAVLCLIGSGSEHKSSLGLLFGCGLALVLAERRALAEAADARGFRPSAFAGTIELLMVLALADAQTCLLLGVVGKTAFSWFFYVSTLALVVGFVGLYRLALWGVVITMTTATALSAGMLLGVLQMHEASVPFGLVFGAQVVAPLPMVYSLATKRPLPQMNPRLRSKAASAFILAVMLLGLIACLGRR